MLPITNENNAANLNAAFVTDNSFEVAEATGTADSRGSGVQSSEEEIAEVVEIDGNIEAETNKSVNNSDIKENMENLENDAAATTTVLVVEEITTIAPETARATDTATFQDDSPSIEQEAEEEQTLTIENNEAMEANNSPNESSNSDVATDDAAASSVSGEEAADEAPVAGAEIENENDNEDEDDADDLRAELDEENINETAASESTNGIDEAVTEPVKSVEDTVEWLGDDAAIAAAPQPGSDIDEVDNESNEKRYANYANNKNREDISSSDDEGEDETEAVQMNPEFDSEWADLKDDLAKASSEERNDLSNDIDAFDAVPIDLSNDIAVNDNPDLPLNPEAEVFDVSGLKKPMFEKLTISGDAQPADK
ncbi:aspartic and glutamic acid-rich protein isoform X1 [Ceratitis capitata]|uniref:aspartic and glutamic acid-rich protein isoform X1 n=1 Tax=Ceratitis capitata TaxID=7213 RepID=UPI00032A2F09|nr:aspartic and glutamic acid-rich protein isoform X1 [Ceratitis capitata]XP_004521671.1 aspartic and glutamic acid-rich protein isoform X1 [Ceratitis capitata]